ncbi:hydrogenase small subunit [bacterium]|nr:hydrogenase small subunit [bacterium]HPF34775.1 hydrogenase small subunit [Candidatus Krumholzibacteria bacterium]HRX51833.1 hydrogenase small subunit [Candidatus Krumholzibacteria bacterium]
MDAKKTLRDEAAQALDHPIGRRNFLKVITAAAAAVGLSSSVAVKMAEAAAAGLKPSVIWLHFQECTGCTESLLRTSHPDVAEVILDLISLDYHETLSAAAGHQIEASLHQAMEQHKGKYICVVEGAIPEKDGGIYCKIGDRTALDILNTVAADAGAIVALGSCASFGGIPASPPNPTGATGAPMILKDKTVVTIPGCPANPYNFLGVVLQYATLGTLPELDQKGRPKFAYGRTIHEDCPRRAHFDAGRFAQMYGDEGHMQGYCLYKLGCKGPATHANCSIQHFCEVPGAWPIGIGHPCVGCTEQQLAFRVPLHDTVDIERPTPPDTYPPILANDSKVSPLATAVGGLVAGAAIGAAVVQSRRLDKEDTND